MIYSLRGTLVFKDTASIAVECGGVAYLCRTTLPTVGAVGAVGDEVLVFTHLSLRNEVLDLYGFHDRQELDCFKLLISVSGVGPKVALAILSSLSPERFALCVAAGDYKPITAAPGVGKRLAERITLELRDKIGGAAMPGAGADAALVAEAGEQSNMSEAISALVVLGYGQTEAAQTVARLDPELPVEEMIKAALKKLARGR